MIKASVNATFKDSPFEYEQLNDPSLQLWTIRVPADVRGWDETGLIPVQTIKTICSHFHPAHLFHWAIRNAQIQINVIYSASRWRAWFLKGGC